ncbi:MAG: hypothetical protein ACRC2J_05410 [Microcoleaceae cyanobacterium]
MLKYSGAIARKKRSPREGLRFLQIFVRLQAFKQNILTHGIN